LTKPYVRAELYSMLLYEFDTLAICLPTEHLGGDLDVRHNNKRLTWTSSKTSAFDLSFSAWYVNLTIKMCYLYAEHSPGMPM
jgi:hypothetical protein